GGSALSLGSSLPASLQNREYGSDWQYQRGAGVNRRAVRVGVLVEVPLRAQQATGSASLVCSPSAVSSSLKPRTRLSAALITISGSSRSLSSGLAPSRRSRLRLRSHIAAWVAPTPDSISESTIIRRSSSPRSAVRRGATPPSPQLRIVLADTPSAWAMSSDVRPVAFRAAIRSPALAVGARPCGVAGRVSVCARPLGSRCAREVSLSTLFAP